MKIMECNKCLKDKPQNDFGFDKRYGTPRQPCKRCRADREKERRKENGPKYYRIRNIRSKYGVSQEEAERLVNATHCEICNVELTTARQNVRCKTDQVIDHCHHSGEVRGVLCSGCNLALGHAEDDPNRLREMANYLERHLTNNH